ncbi:MAG: alpha-amylase family glycosyl hydrolase [Eubacteriales bacterium]
MRKKKMGALVTMAKTGKVILLPKRTYPIQFGVMIVEDVIEFAITMKQEACGMIFYTKHNSIRIPFTDECKIGQVYSGRILGLPLRQIAGYNYYTKDKIIVDPYAKRVIGNERFGGNGEVDTLERKGALVSPVFDWENDKRPRIPHSNTIQYLLHVRGFTKHKSSKVKAKGTFSGIIEKIPYLKQLGITSVEAMPCYEFEEVEKQDSSMRMEYAVRHYREEKVEAPIQKLNCWGYKYAHYFAPKSSYASSSDCVTEMKEMIKQLHLAGLEFIMQFYFPKDIPYQVMYDVIAYWIVEYHIDGVHLMGEQIPFAILGKEALFHDTKMFFERLSIDEIYDGTGEVNTSLAMYHSDFMIGIRKFLKGDQDTIAGFVESLKIHDGRVATVQYISNYNEFTLHDMVSYDQKHNEDNGENNEDGNRYNHSWNHGVEGITRKRSIMALRKKQMKNAMTYLLLSQGTPMILAGDEFAYTRRGNNNAYCHDNDLLWLDWSGITKHQDLLDYVKMLIRLRKDNQIIHPSKPFKMVDTLGCGYPDLSYHGEEAWQPILENYCRCVGLLYAGAYGVPLNGKVEPDYYIAYNAHWEPHEFALPRLKKGYEWYMIASTSDSDSIKGQVLMNQNGIQVKERSVQIIMSKPIN